MDIRAVSRLLYVRKARPTGVDRLSNRASLARGSQVHAFSRHFPAFQMCHAQVFPLGRARRRLRLHGSRFESRERVHGVE